MHIITTLIDFILHLDTHLAEIIQTYGILTYVLLFGVVFAETGLVILPFLPGDSLLFAAGTLSALHSLLLPLVVGLLLGAAILGDSINYWIGNALGQKIVDNQKISFINQEHINRTEVFYKKYGGKAIILARFIPIVRTFAPFVAGVGKMEYQTFFLYNVIGAVLWVSLFVFLGYFFGNLPVVRDHFSLVVVGIIALSVAPVIMEYIKHQHRRAISQDTLEEIVNN